MRTDKRSGVEPVEKRHGEHPGEANHKPDTGVKTSGGTGEHEHGPSHVSRPSDDNDEADVLKGLRRKGEHLEHEWDPYFVVSFILFVWTNYVFLGRASTLEILVGVLLVYALGFLTLGLLSLLDKGFATLLDPCIQLRVGLAVTGLLGERFLPGAVETDFAKSLIAVCFFFCGATDVAALQRWRWHRRRHAKAAKS